MTEKLRSAFNSFIKLFVIKTSETFCCQLIIWRFLQAKFLDWWMILHTWQITIFRSKLLRLPWTEKRCQSKFVHKKMCFFVLIRFKWQSFLQTFFYFSFNLSYLKGHASRIYAIDWRCDSRRNTAAVRWAGYCISFFPVFYNYFLSFLTLTNITVTPI